MNMMNFDTPTGNPDRVLIDASTQPEYVSDEPTVPMQANPLSPTDTTPITPPMKMRGQMHGARYGEVLLVSGHLNHIEATVFNTLGLNDCPDDLWQTLDAKTIKKAYKARAVILNGPRYFLMDEIGSADVGKELFTFGELQMRRMATVSIPIGGLLSDVRRSPYSERTVNRTTTYVFKSGREVYELVAPDGTTYIMQSYSLIVDATLTEQGLKTLGTRLHLPAGNTVFDSLPRIVFCT